MLKIHKQAFEVTPGDFSLMMPLGAQVLTVQVQPGPDGGEAACIWYAYDPDAIFVSKTFRVFGTGDDIEGEEAKGLSYIGTFQLLGGRFVGHLFERVLAAGAASPSGKLIELIGKGWG